MNKWQRKAIALARLAQDQHGKPEGATAEAKLLEILNKHPEATGFEPIVNEVVKLEEIKLKDLAEIKRAGGNLDGSWSGRNFDEAIKAVCRDYQERLTIARRKRLYTNA